MGKKPLCDYKKCCKVGNIPGGQHHAVLGKTYCKFPIAKRQAMAELIQPSPSYMCAFVRQTKICVF